jgi:hypothetical protein
MYQENDTKKFYFLNDADKQKGLPARNNATTAAVR